MEWHKPRDFLPLLRQRNKWDLCFRQEGKMLALRSYQSRALRVQMVELGQVEDS